MIGRSGGRVCGISVPVARHDDDDDDDLTQKWNRNWYDLCGLGYLNVMAMER